MSNQKSVDVEYMGATWLVCGTWGYEEPDSWDCPGTIAGFDDYEIFHGTTSEGDGMDMYELLKQTHIDNIVELAEVEIKEGGERDEY